MKRISLTIATLLLPLLAACNDPRSARGFSLPDGDTKAGREVFVELQCVACHEVAKLDLPRPAEVERTIVLGGEVNRIKTYGELVTSVINPSHRLAGGYARDEIAVDGVSLMRTYNDSLTVTQLIDLVAFLQSHYELMEYVPSDYPMYP